MSATVVAHGVIALVAAGLMLTGPALANDAHKMAEKFASDGGTKAKQTESERKIANAKKREDEKAEAAKKQAERMIAEARKRAAERRAAEVRQREAQHKAEVQRRAAAAKQMAAENARSAVEQRQADEAEMLARARREAGEMRAAEEHERLAQEARRLIDEADKERAMAEALLARQPEEQRTTAADEESLARQRSEETRALVEKLKRVRQIRDARLAAQARRVTSGRVPDATPEPPAEPVVVASPAPASEPVTTPAEPPPAATAADPEPLPLPAQDSVPPGTRSEVTAEALGKPRPPLPESTQSPVALAPKSTPLAPQPAVAAAAPTEPVAPPPHAAKPAVTTPVAPSGSEAKPEAPSQSAAELPRRLSETYVTVLLILEPGTYGIRRRGPRTADPVLCVSDGCYISAGPDHPAVFMPGRRALRFANTLGARAGACRHSLGCVFRGVELASLPGYLQPVDLHIFKHDRRRSHAVHADSGCKATAGRLSCSHGIHAEDYTMWVLSESQAEFVGPEALERAVADGLNGPRSAQLLPR